MKKYILLIFAAFICLAGIAQSQDKTIFRAMDAELDRSMTELQMNDLGKPFWVGYIYSDLRVMQITSSLGEISYSAYVPQRLNSTRVLFGDYNMTSDVNYPTGYMARGSAIESNEEQIRREFWLNTDANYKQTAPGMARKAAMRRQSARTPEEMALPDMLAVNPVEKYTEWYKFAFDRAEWEKTAKTLSALFTEYPSLYKSAVSILAYDMTDYVANSEGVRIKHPASFASLIVEAMVRTPDGEEFTDRFDIYAPSDTTLPSTEVLLKRVRQFAENLSLFANAPKIEEFYSGPVLFVGQPVFSMFDNNLLPNNGNGLLVKRRAEMSGNQNQYGNQQTGNSRRLENRLGQRVIDRKFSVTNHSSLRDFGDTPLLGYYEIDSDGVVPEADMVIIENGMLQTVLNGRIPTLKSPASTGSNRLSINVNPAVAPGTLEVKASGGKPLAELEKELITLAKNDGLKYAYIVEHMNNKFNMLWKIDTETGERTLVRNGDIQPVGLTQLKRVAGVSNECEVRNYLSGQVPASMIYPRAILLEDVEIGELETTKDKPSPIVNPLERK